MRLNAWIICWRLFYKNSFLFCLCMKKFVTHVASDTVHTARNKINYLVFEINFRHGHLYTEQLSCHLFFWQVYSMRRELGTQITPRGWIFWTMIFSILKNSHQDLSNEGSNFILSWLEVGRWVAQTWLFF